MKIWNTEEGRKRRKNGKNTYRDEAINVSESKKKDKEKRT